MRMLPELVRAITDIYISYYWLEPMLPLDAMFIISGAAPKTVSTAIHMALLYLLPPSSRKLFGVPEDPPAFVDARDPSKYGSRLIDVPL